MSIIRGLARKPSQRSATGIVLLRGKRYLATGFIHINRLPEHVESVAAVLSIAQRHSTVYSIWPNIPRLTENKRIRHVSVRLVTERIPSTIPEIAELPDPTEDEIKKLKMQLVAITDAIKTELKSPCFPILTDPGMFQRSARTALGLGPETRRFDQKTTGKPTYTRGLIDGYRQGFRRAKRNKMKEHISNSSKDSEDEL
ncbi:hypothetical protein GGI23_007252, partial [Coemansia sp. RSA 2559]